MNVDRQKRAHIFESRDAARRGDFQGGGGSQPPEPVKIGALQHAFFVDVSAEEAGAVWLKSSEHFFRSEAGRLAPALYYDVALFRIKRDHQTLGSDGGGEFCKERLVDPLGRESSGAHNHFVRALLNEGSGAV